MTETKRWYQSKSVWGTGLGILILAFDVFFGITPLPVDDEYARALALLSTVVGFIGRLVAQKRLTA